MSKNLPSIFSSSDAPLATVNGGQRIATRMAENLLSVARTQEQALVAQRRYHIGDYEFREADHAQIQRWARMLGMEPAKVVEVLASSQKEDSFGPTTEFSVQDGAIVSLVWDFGLLPLTDWAWGRGLQIARLAILNASRGSLPTLPNCLCEFICDDNRLIELDLIHAPGLLEIGCINNHLTSLNLTHLQGLYKLGCGYNQLTTLDLTPIPRLQELSCNENQLTNLDLTPVPELRWLFCRDNQLTGLNLTPVPGLRWLLCSNNQMNALDLTHVPELQQLACCSNELTELDLTPVSDLKALFCDASVSIKNPPPNLEVHRR